MARWLCLDDGQDWADVPDRGDCGIVLQAIAGKDEKDPGTAGKSFYFSPSSSATEDNPRRISPVDFEAWADLRRARCFVRRSMLSES